VIVMRAERLLKPKRAGKSTDATDGDFGTDSSDGGDAAATDFAALEDYVASPADFASLVFVATDIDRSRRFTKKLVEKAQVVMFGGIRAEPRSGPAGANAALGLARKFVLEEMSREGRTLEPAAVTMLLGRSGADISKLRGDIERLLLFVADRKTISGADVEEVASNAATVEDDWAVTNAIGAGNAALGLRELALRFERGDSPHGIVGQLRWWVSNQLAAGAPDRVKPALDALLRTDLALKSSGGEDQVLLERLVVELTGRPVPRGGGYGRR
jgi:hypothetical protein